MTRLSPNANAPTRRHLRASHLSPNANAFTRRHALTLWALRALWASMLLSPMVLWAFATHLTDNINEAIALGYSQNVWVDSPPWGLWLVAAALAVASIALPSAVDRRGVIHLRSLVEYDLDLTEPGHYRKAPTFMIAVTNALVGRALARYAGRLALSFAMLGTIVLLSVLLVGSAEKSCGIGGCERRFSRPIDYLPMAALACFLVAIQFPTRRRVLGILLPLLP